MSCAFFGYGLEKKACSIACRCQQACGEPADTDCPHDGDGDKCNIIKAKVAEAHDAN